MRCSAVLRQWRYPIIIVGLIFLAFVFSAAWLSLSQPTAEMKAAGELEQLGARVDWSGRGPPCLGMARVLSVSLAGLMLVDDDLKKCVSNLNRLPWLVKLDISDNPITDSGLTEIGRIPRVQELCLSNTLVSGSGASALRPLKQLCCIQLIGCPVDTAGIREFAALPGVRVVHISNHRLGASDLESITVEKPKLQVIEIDDTSE